MEAGPDSVERRGCIVPDNEQSCNSPDIPIQRKFFVWFYPLENASEASVFRISAARARLNATRNGGRTLALTAQRARSFAMSP